MAEVNVNEKPIGDVAAKTEALYNKIQEMAFKFEEDTAGAKLARDKAKAVTG